MRNEGGTEKEEGWREAEGMLRLQRRQWSAVGRFGLFMVGSEQGL